MGQSLGTILWLAQKELRSFLRDYVMLVLVIFVFSLGVVAQAQNTAQEVTKATIAVADEDHSRLSDAITLNFLPPYFKPAVMVDERDIDVLLDNAKYTFIVVLPPHFESDVEAGRVPNVQIDIDATAAMQAGIGAGYVQQIITDAIDRNISRSSSAFPDAVTLTLHMAFNPNATSGWFMAMMAIVNNITMLAIILCGAAVIREREHGTMDHLLTLPLSPTQIASAKVVANGIVILVATAISLTLIVRGLLAVPIAGSIPLFLVGVALYVFYALSLGLFLATIVGSMPQFGLLFILVVVPLQMLSGGNTPLESEPYILQIIMHGVASTYFVSYAQAILFRGAGFTLVYKDFLIVAGMGLVFFVISVMRFRRVSAITG